jgi:hypothetical protein
MELVDASDDALVQLTWEELRMLRAGLRQAAREADWEFQTVTGYEPAEMVALAERIDAVLFAGGHGHVLP